MVGFLIGPETSGLGIRIEHQVSVPIGAGFGASAAGTLSAALALADAVGIDHTVDQIALAAHRAEIVSRTGLGTVPALLRGGFVLIRKAGGPGIAVIDQIPSRSSYRVVACHFGPISTSQVLGTANLRRVVNRAGARAMRRILAKPTAERFMLESRAFAEQIGLLSRRARHAVEVAIGAGAIGATQNMLGDAIHALAEEQTAIVVERRLRRAFPKAQVFASEIERAGARLI
jgi:pantoate kinase